MVRKGRIIKQELVGRARANVQIQSICRNFLAGIKSGFWNVSCSILFWLFYHRVLDIGTVSTLQFIAMDTNNSKKFVEAVVGGIFFGSVYFLCKFQVALEQDGNPVDPTSMVAQFFWFAKMFLGVFAAKLAGQEMVHLIEKAFPMVQQAIAQQQETVLADERAKKAEERATRAQERISASIETKATVTNQEPTTDVRQRKSNVQAYPADELE